MPAKNCPRCKGAFHCQVAQITACGCSKIKATAAEIQLIQQVAADCLCNPCFRACLELIRGGDSTPQALARLKEFMEPS